MPGNARVIGIDPGLSGAIAVISDGHLEIVDTPTFTVGKATKRDYNVGQMHQILMRLSGGMDDIPAHAFLESVHALPQSGRAAMFTMGKGFGIWLALLTSLHVGFDLVSPQRWKGVMLDGMAKDKDASRLRALQMFPASADLFQRKKDDGRAEAALIAEYGRRISR